MNINQTNNARGDAQIALFRPWLNAVKFWAVGMLMVAAAVMMFSTVARADHEGGDWSKTPWNNDHVIVFSECGFRGDFKTIPRGDFTRMKRVGVDQNAISSILIPDGLAVEIFQKTDYQGHWYRLNQSQDCLQGRWNDRIGSMRVMNDDVGNSFGYSDGYGAAADGCYNFSVESRRGRGAFRLVDEESKLNRVRRGEVIEGEICNMESVRFELAKRDQSTNVTLRIADKEYRFGPNDAYDDFRRDWYRSFVTINLPRGRGDDTEYGRGQWGNTDGFGPRYSSGIKSGENWGNNYRGRWYGSSAQSNAGSSKSSYTHSGRDYDNDDANTASNNSNNSSNNNSSGCTPYRIIGNHSDTGLRFLTGDQQFYQVNNGSINGDLCQVGAVRVELAKKNLGSTVVLQIGGRSYVFRGGDKGNEYRNYWYRKYVTINVQ